MNAATATPARSADSRPRGRQPVLDPVCAEAVELALAAAEDVAGIGEVGRHVGVVAEGDRVVTHLFECRERGYRGWNWAVTLTRAPRTKFVTLDETVLVAGRGSVLAPDWVPWSERLQPGDLGPGDLLPIAEDDPRLVPAYTGEDEAQPVPYREIMRDTLPLVSYELGLGRPRVLSRQGREEAAERWHEGEFGPHSPMAQAAPARCSGCGFLTPLAGMLGQAFGVCTNEIAPSDGRVVSLDFGCGAHSEAAVVPAANPTSEPVVDEYVYDTVTFGERVVVPGAGAGTPAAETAEASESAGSAEAPDELTGMLAEAVAEESRESGEVAETEVPVPSVSEVPEAVVAPEPGAAADESEPEVPEAVAADKTNEAADDSEAAAPEPETAPIEAVEVSAEAVAVAEAMLQEAPDDDDES
ncbi:MAG: hypothetical protein AUG49_01170 [Catenulispora sp. 13_1_20CM_3_70_7]|nr:DUF3027 domain-containing protein [Catenulisporales bacterium]OLE28868.1 MAG: hypothetical protein AUG49_01170 [Catenulispora sp. 13_1_20CM_3_70_7]